MKAVMVMFDSLRRDFLSPYNCDADTPAFSYLAERSVTFDQSWACSLPCMPARRELHTGRPNFYHRSWGPVEPFDDSMPQILRDNRITSHLVSDHQHYWEDGGCTYHTRYSSWECSRGQEGDKWKEDLRVRCSFDSVFRCRQRELVRNSEAFSSPEGLFAHDMVNRKVMAEKGITSQDVTFDDGLEFLERNHGCDGWFLQIETFDPHEPFFTLKENLSPDRYTDSDWPPYARVEEDEETVRNVRNEYSSLVSKCDASLSRVLDAFDRYALWDDTMLIVNTDHGFLLSEHGWWGKTDMPVYQQIAHTPLFIHDPRHKDCDGQRRKALVQTYDLPVTVLRYYGLSVPHDMLGHDLECVIAHDRKVRNTAIYGYFGSQINATDGHWLYMMSPSSKDVEVFEYTLMPAHMRAMFSVEELRSAVLAPPFSFTKGIPVMRIRPSYVMGDTCSFPCGLYNLDEDPQMNRCVNDDELRGHFRKEIVNDMRRCDAPEELYKRFALEDVYEGC